jgi:hypothetical protein
VLIGVRLVSGSPPILPDLLAGQHGKQNDRDGHRERWVIHGEVHLDLTGSRAPALQQGPLLDHFLPDGFDGAYNLSDRCQARRWDFVDGGARWGQLSMARPSI